MGPLDGGIPFTIIISGGGSIEIAACARRPYLLLPNATTERSDTSGARYERSECSAPLIFRM